MDKGHCSEFGIITSFLWVKSTVPSLVLLRVFVDKRHCSEIGIITCLFFIKGTVLISVLLHIIFHVVIVR